ncbi:hypothetical protein FG87_38165 [Nocardia vulneris]|uniref:Terminase small subunit n=2 Tax=Nocardia vulneris TaxID=1141657 RepID=A0ABR4Z4H7_9NOCA|nr:hypothetical protein FG87_38165 [Nocardia vulneris]
MPGDLVALPEVDWNEYFNPPKPPREPKGKRAKASTRPEGASASESDSDGNTGAAEPGVDLDATKPGNRWARKALLIAEGIETKRIPERYRGGVDRIAEALASFARPGARYDLALLQAAQALGDLAAAMGADETSQ